MVKSPVILLGTDVHLKKDDFPSISWTFSKRLVGLTKYIWSKLSNRLLSKVQSKDDGKLKPKSKSYAPEGWKILPWW